MIAIARKESKRRIEILNASQISDDKKAWARRVMHRQNKFARKIGLPMISGLINFGLAAIFLAIIYEAALLLIDNGYIVAPESAHEITSK